MIGADPRGLDPALAKTELRRRLIAGRARRPPVDRVRVAADLARAADLAPLSGVRTVTGYLAIGSEPDPAGLLAVLRGRGVRVLLPVAGPRRQLAWVADEDPAGERPGRYGTREPVGPPADDAAGADVLLIPALAAAADGARLGRGGGFYDRFLARARPTGLVLAVVHDDELLPRLPTQAHDQPVDGVLRPSGLTTCTPGRGGRPG